jgi:hypothetical protein
MATLLSPADMVLDCLHYASKLDPTPNTNGLYAVGVTLRPSDGVHKQLQLEKTTTAIKMAPSKAHAILDLVSIDGYQTHLPPFRISTNLRVSKMAEAWTRVQPVGNVALTEDDQTTLNTSVCISTVDHENTQLKWGRQSAHHPTQAVPSCDYQQECVANSLRGTQGPLQCYLTPLQQQAFDTTGSLPEPPYFCLLCIRRDVHAFQLVHSTVTNTHMCAGRGVFVIPPFQNLVDVPGGYHASAMATTTDMLLPVPVNICGVTGTLEVRYDTIHKQWFIDQGSIIYQGEMQPNPDFQPHSVN